MFTINSSRRILVPAGCGECANRIGENPNRIESHRKWNNRSFLVETNRIDETQHRRCGWIAPNGKRQGYMGWQKDYFNLTLENGYEFSINGGNVGIGTTNPAYKLDVNGIIKGDSVQHLKCGTSHYRCTPKACLNLCIGKGMRMATFGELYALASSGKDICAYMWHLNPDFPNNPCRGFPMYHNRTTGGCGRIGTGNIPRMEGISNGFSWNSSAKYDCACSSLK
uniref:Link domain-containing protein n=1 Tax=Candidatus Kentrum sp. TC TaxID=2126339 RepID=A0A450YIR3_9GAMM|nr:MAG: hypothetical protein BECKTC1821E_GA0114239_101152 [Candidatus Kentron sp. TC]